MKKLYSVLFLTMLCIVSFAQKESAVWYFGTYAGINFNSGSAVALTGGKINTYEGCASIADPSGNLLFYTDGLTVWDKTHTIMPNGTGLKGGASSTQSAIIVPKPGSCGLYYIFTVGDFGNPGDLRYSVVDMCLNSGNGDIVTSSKNTLLYEPCEEKLTSIIHSNGKDVWIVAHDLGNANFRSYLLTSAGVNTTPVITSIGTSHATNMEIGPMKSSHNGKKIAIECTFWGPLFELFDFNASTGSLSGYINLLTKYTLPSAGYYGVEFSPNDSLLYAACTYGNNSIYQINLQSTSYVTLFTSSSSGYDIGAIQLAPDGKIYAARNTLSYLSVINKPNVLGTGCNFVDNGFTLAAGTSSQMGLPNFVPAISNKTLNNYALNIGHDTLLPCTGGAFTINLSNCNATYLWQDGSTKSSLTIDSSGTYWVKETSACGVHSDTLVVSSDSSATAPVITISGGSTSFCAGTKSITSSNSNNNQWYLNGNLISGAIGQSYYPTQSGFYSVKDSSAGGCVSASSALSLTVLSAPDVTVSCASSGTGQYTQKIANTCTYCAGTKISLTVIATGTYSWSTGDVIDSTIVSPLTTATYTVTVTGSNGCTTSLAQTVNINPLPPIPTIQQNGNTLTSSSVTNNQWYYGGNIITGATGQYYSPTISASYTVKVTNSNGCSATSNPFSFVYTGIEEYNVLSSIIAYPNPSNGQLYIDVPVNVKSELTISLINMLGQIIYSSILQNSSKTVHLDIADHVSNGVYMLMLQTESAKSVRKIIIEK